MGGLVALFLSAVLGMYVMLAMVGSSARLHAISLQRAAQYLLVVEERGKYNAQQQLMGWEQSGASLGVPSGFSGVACAAATLPSGAPCRYNATASFTLAGQSTGPSSSGSAMCANLNTNSHVAESCISYRERTSITDAGSGETLATRFSLVTYRVSKVAPYAVIVGEAASGATQEIQETNIGGCAPQIAGATTASCSSTDGTTQPLDTTLHSYSQCADGYISCSGQSNPVVDTTSSALSANNNYTSTNQAASGWQP